MSPFRSPLILLICAVGVTLAACGSSSGGSAGGSSSPAAAPSSPVTTASAAAPPSPVPASSAAGGSAAATTIAANWTAFFSAKTPVARRVSLLQDGPQFASIIKSQAGSGLAAEASAKVTKVAVTSASQATVTYSILVAGQSALSGKTGTAVLQDGVWKVGVASFCGLITLEDTGSSAKLPAACGSAG
jgi:hypothetical protein